jgi:putative ABC transport system permease protein
MSVLRAWFHRFCNLFRRERLDRELDAELASHLEMHIEDNLRAGLTPEEARRVALIKLGGIEQIKESHRDRRTLRSFENFLGDVRFALRMLRKNPGFSIVAILTLAIGIAASTLIFSFVDCVLLYPFPYKDFGRTATFAVHDFSRGPEHRGHNIPIPIFVALRNQNHSFDQLMASYEWDVRYDNGKETRQLVAAWLTSNGLEFYGVPPLLGRWFTDADGSPKADAVFLASYAFWRDELGSDRAALGKTFILNNKSRTLIGIMPQGFAAFHPAGLYLPLGLYPGAEGGSFFGRPSSPTPAARLRPGVSLEAAAADLNVIAHDLATANPDDWPKDFSIVTENLAEFRYGGYRKTLLALQAASLLLLLISCTNVANLLLARATSREKEIAVRSTLGAGHARILSQLLTESLVLSSLATILGVAWAYFGLRAVLLLLPFGWLPTERPIALNHSVLWFSLGAALLTALLAGITPALHSVSGSLRAGMAAGGRSVSSSARQDRLRSALVASEIALSVILLVAAGLMTRTFIALTRVDLGIDPTNISYAMLATPTGRYDSGAQKKLLIRPVLDRVRSIPGVLAAAQTTGWPPGAGAAEADVTVQGRPRTERWVLAATQVSDEFDTTLGLHLISGRWITEHEADSAAHILVVNEALARQHFPGQNPVGQRIQVGGFNELPDAPRNVFFEIVGVISDCKNSGLREPVAAHVYIPYTFTGVVLDRTILVKTAAAQPNILQSVRSEVSGVDRDVAFRESGTVLGDLQNSLAESRFILATISAFACVGLVLLLVGVFGVTSYTVEMRQHEFGIRIALGATSRTILLSVFRRAAILILAGGFFGVVASPVATRLIASQIYGVSLVDGWTYSAVLALIICTSLMATYVPAQRATRVDPVVSLRYE